MAVGSERKGFTYTYFEPSLQRGRGGVGAREMRGRKRRQGNCHRRKRRGGGRKATVGESQPNRRLPSPHQDCCLRPLSPRPRARQKRKTKRSLLSLLPLLPVRRHPTVVRPPAGAAVCRSARPSGRGGGSGSGSNRTERREEYMGGVRTPVNGRWSGGVAAARGGGGAGTASGGERRRWSRYGERRREQAGVSGE